MRASCGVYARLGRYFSDADELADAAVMTRPTLSRVLKGQREFTRQEKAAIGDTIKTRRSDPRLSGLFCFSNKRKGREKNGRV